MQFRTILYLILWIVLAFLLFRSCQPDSGGPAETFAGRVESFDAPDRPAEERLILDTDLLWMEWTRRGAACTTIKLKDFTDRVLIDGEENGQASWLTLFEAVPAYPPPPGGEAEGKHHRARGALRLFDPAGILAVDLDGADWEVEQLEHEDGQELVFTLESGGREGSAGAERPRVRVTKRVRAFDGERHLLVEVSAESLEEDRVYGTLQLQLGTGGGILRVEDRFYPNPYVGAALWEHGEVSDIEQYVPRGTLKNPNRRSSVERWSGSYAFVVEGSKYFLNALRPLAPGEFFLFAEAEALYDERAYESAMYRGLSDAERADMALVARTNARLTGEKGRPPTAAELAAATGLSDADAARWVGEYAARSGKAREFVTEPWRRASVSGGFDLDVRPAGSKQFQWYLGPKDPAVLSAPAYQPLDAIISRIDYGGSFFYDIFFTRYIAPAILWIIEIFQSIVRNWGVAIILMTVLVRGLLFPINRRGQVRMAQYQAKVAKVKPQLEALKKKYSDPQKRNEETMKVYREHKLSPPIGGCLPILLQFPVFIGLFAALRCSILLRQKPFAFWIHDLSKPDALIDFGGPVMDFFPLSGVTTLNVLPLLMVVVWVWHTKSMPKPQDPQSAQMQKVMVFMPVLFGFLLYNYAAGLSLYMITSSSIGIFESKVIKKKWPITPAADAKPA